MAYFFHWFSFIRSIFLLALHSSPHVACPDSGPKDGSFKAPAVRRLPQSLGSQIWSAEQRSDPPGNQEPELQVSRPGLHQAYPSSSVIQASSNYTKWETTVERDIKTKAIVVQCKTFKNEYTKVKMRTKSTWGVSNNLTQDSQKK